MRILIADDDVLASAVLDAALRKLGHDVVLVADGEIAWRAFNLDPTRIVVSDWMMPGINGLELCERIRAKGGSYTYFILLSSLDAKGINLEQALAAGVDDFLTKPVNPEELRMRLHVAERILNFAMQVQQLESFIPICSYCRKVRDDANYWDRIENYINARTGSRFSHGICPDCYTREFVPQLKKAGVTPPPYPDEDMPSSK